MKNYHLHIEGRVQGVGFRPFVYREAKTKKLNGWVSNTVDGVHIEVNASGEDEIKDFCDILKEKCPPQARIEGIEFRQLPFHTFNEFRIIKSGHDGVANLPVTPDFAMCEDCRQELNDKNDRRFEYPFITCTNCGPRFSIIHRLPYEREFTTMEKFTMCPECENEYNEPEDRRFYSQTNSCPKCKIQLGLFDKDGIRLPGSEADIIKKTRRLILDGKILAVKGIGGYLLMADATSAQVIQTLRARKKRPAKPFALMYPDTNMVLKDLIVNEKILNEWQGPECPIVLCPLKKHPGTGIIPELIAPGLSRMGVMMPYTPLFYLLLKEVNIPLIATSGNVSGSPIIYTEEGARDHLKDIADIFLVNNRDILIPQDDSVVQYSTRFQEKIILRRSRGLAPTIDDYSARDFKDISLLAMGAMLKSTFGMLHDGRYYVSQYLGDTTTLESQETYQHVLDHMVRVLDFKPSVIIADNHPDYPATILGERLAERFRARLRHVQHHHAHAYAVMGEHHLLNDQGVLNVIWDGLGLGDDKNIWGGEFLWSGNGVLKRKGHWDYFPYLAGDKMSREPRIAAFSLTNGNDLLKNKFTGEEWGLYKQLRQRPDVYTSSAGRIFDGVASLLNLSDVNTYEGESAMYLESLANDFFEKNKNFRDYYDIDISQSGIIGTGNLIDGILDDLARDRSKGMIAAKFHLTLVEVIRKFAAKMSTQKITFSGGVFQNALLVDLIKMKMDDRFSLYFHKNLSPNDECISYGQMTGYLHQLKISDKINVLQTQLNI